MSNFIINQEHRGVDDTVVASAYRAGRKYNIDGKVLLRIRARWYEMKDMRVSLFVAIKKAYEKACAEAERQYQAERSKHEVNSKLISITDFIAGTHDEKNKSE